jgi:hypothetical protein
VALIVAFIAVAVFTGLFPSLGKSAVSEDRMPAIKVIISNGCGYERLAFDYAQHIKDKNIEVIRLADTPKPIYNKSLIVVKTGDQQDLQRLQRMTGITRFTYATSEGYEVPFIIILGSDYEEYMN